MLVSKRFNPIQNGLFWSFFGGGGGGWRGAERATFVISLLLNELKRNLAGVVIGW